MTQNTQPQSDSLLALMYVSTASGPVDAAALDNILATARAANSQMNVTGILLYRRGQFYQYLEGPESAVREVYRRIAGDPRHTDLRVLVDHEVSERRFATWTMGYEPLRSASSVVPSGFRDTFADLSDADPQIVLRAVAAVALWYGARAARA